jgi:CheY-like chemotaxis protein
MHPLPTILIVEDDEGHAILVRDNLAEAGLTKRWVHFRARQDVRDIRLPKVDGIGILRRLKVDRERRKRPVIMPTTADDAQDIERCHQPGRSGYVPKPVDYLGIADAIPRLGRLVNLISLPTVS